MICLFMCLSANWSASDRGLVRLSMCLPVDWPVYILICLSARSGIGQSVCPCVLSANAVCVSEAWFAYHIYVYKVLGSAALGWQGQPRQYSI